MNALADWLRFAATAAPELWLRTGEHIVLTGTATLIAIAAGLPLGILAARRVRLQAPLLALVGTLQTVPSLAMLALLLVLLGRIGALPAIIALTLYALLPIVRNTLTGISQVAPDIVEAARGMGMTAGQKLRLVELPLAAPVIVAGIRTAAVVGVGIATLSAFIGAGGLGQFINRGLALADTRLILLGAIPAAILALAIDAAIAAFQWGLTGRRKPAATPAARLVRDTARIGALALPALILAVGLAAFASGRGGAGAGPGESVRVGSKNFTEQFILAEMMAQMIEAHTDLAVERRFNLGGTMIAHNALAAGEIDLYAEYTGTALTAILGADTVSDPDHALALVRDAYRDRFGLVWLAPFGFDNTYALAVRGADAAQHSWRAISDLVAVAAELRAGFPAEFAERPDGYPGLARAYGLAFGAVRDLDPSLMYGALAGGEVDVIAAFATDGRIAALKLATLADDRGFFPPYQAAPVARASLLRRRPEIAAALAPLAGRIDETTMRALNHRVDGENRAPRAVARAFLIENRLIDRPSSAADTR